MHGERITKTGCVSTYVSQHVCGKPFGFGNDTEYEASVCDVAPDGVPRQKEKTAQKPWRCERAPNQGLTPVGDVSWYPTNYKGGKKQSPLLRPSCAPTITTVAAGR